MSELAQPHGFRDGLAGALALIADRFSPAELAELRGQFGLPEHFSPVHDARGRIEGWRPTRWPLECDAALATLAARALAPSDPALAWVLERVRADADDEELRRLAGIVRGDWSEDELAAELAQIASHPSSAASRALAAAHRCTPMSSYDVHRRLASTTAVSAAALLRMALDAQRTTPRELLETVRHWTPTGEHGGAQADARLTVASWPGFAVLLDGDAGTALPPRIAQAFAEASNLDETHQAFRSLTDGLDGAGVVAAFDEDGVACRRGTVDAWAVHGDSVTRVSDGCARFGGRDATLGLSVGALDEPALRATAQAPLERALARLMPPPRAPGLSELFFPGRGASSTPSALIGLAMVRAPEAPRPSLAPEPERLAARRQAVEQIVRALLRARRGLEAKVHERGSVETNAALERVGVLEVLLLRDDVRGADSETDAARSIEDALRQRPELGPVHVSADYVK